MTGSALTTVSLAIMAIAFMFSTTNADGEVGLGANFLITVSFPAMSAWSLPVTYGMYALFAALSFVYVAWRIPETKGMDIEQTETLFVSRRTAQTRSAPAGS